MRPHSVPRTLRTIRMPDARPSDAIALAIRQDAPLYIEEEVLDASSFPFLFKRNQQSEEELAEFKTFLDHISPEDFGNIDQL